jgi:hypothetical protein
MMAFTNSIDMACLSYPLGAHAPNITNRDDVRKRAIIDGSTSSVALLLGVAPLQQKSRDVTLGY